MIKRILILTIGVLLAMTSLAQGPELTVKEHLEDYDYVVNYIEDNYSGFHNKVTNDTRAGYESMKARVRTQVQQGERTGWDAVAEYTAWFEDYHTRLCRDVEDSEGNTVQYNDKFWTRKSICYEDSMVVYDPTAVAIMVTEKTFLIRFPSCYGEPDMDWIKGSIRQFKDSGCENLILDIRGNGGGSDSFFDPYWELLYDHEGAQAGIEYRNTSTNRDVFLGYMQERGLTDEYIKRVKSFLSLTNHLDYIPFQLVQKILTLAYLNPSPSQQDMDKLLSGLSEKEYSTIPFQCSKVDASVRKAALIIDNGVASSGEQLVRQIRLTSDRTTIYGRDNTAGCLDYSNIAEPEMPNCQYAFTCPMTRIMGLPDTGIDDIGMPPDVRIPLPLPARLTDNIDEWAFWVAQQLEQ